MLRDNINIGENIKNPKGKKGPVQRALLDEQIEKE